MSAAAIALRWKAVRPVHPGEILREEFMIPLGLSANFLARGLAVTPARINDVVRERRGITADTALLSMKHRELLTECEVFECLFRPQPENGPDAREPQGRENHIQGVSDPTRVKSTVSMRLPFWRMTDKTHSSYFLRSNFCQLPPRSTFGLKFGLSATTYSPAPLAHALL